MMQFIRLILGMFGLFWRGLGACRRFTANVLFLVVILFIIITLLSRVRENVPQGSALILAPVGNIVDQKTYVDPLETFMDQTLGDTFKEETLLKDIIDALDSAREDLRIKALVLDLNKMANAGISKLQEIGSALNRFKESGKPIIVAGDAFTQNQYYLAAHADKIFLNPMGAVLLTGFGVYRIYYKDLLEKLLVQIHVFRVGKYKSALEPFLRNDMSDAAKEANTAWLQVLWDAYRRDVAAARRQAPDKIDDYINGIAEHLARVQGDAAKLALDLGLVDGLKTRDENRDYLIQLVGEDESGNDFKKIDFNEYLRLTRPVLEKAGQNDSLVAVIVAKGTILDGKQPAGKIGGDSLADLIQQARENQAIKALVLRIDSGGGSAFASEIIRREVELTRSEGIPVIVSMGSLAASGGYWIAAAADEIWATPTTITGSIGIFGLFPTFEKSLDALGVHNDGVGTTQMANAFDPSRQMNPLLEKAMQQIIEQGYQRFISLVSEGRKIPQDKVEKIAQGRVWSGKTALELGLVDRLGNLKDAVASAAARAALEDYEVFYLEQPMTIKEKVLNLLSIALGRMTRTVERRNPQAAARLWGTVRADLKTFLEMNDPQGIYAHCIACDVQ